jgi:hypothetical protein
LPTQGRTSDPSTYAHRRTYTPHLRTLLFVPEITHNSSVISCVSCSDSSDWRMPKVWMHVCSRFSNERSTCLTQGLTGQHLPDQAVLLLLLFYYSATASPCPYHGRGNARPRLLWTYLQHLVISQAFSFMRLHFAHAGQGKARTGQASRAAFTSARLLHDGNT